MSSSLEQSIATSFYSTAKPDDCFQLRNIFFCSCGLSLIFSFCVFLVSSFFYQTQNTRLMIINIIAYYPVYCILITICGIICVSYLFDKHVKLNMKYILSNNLQLYHVLPAGNLLIMAFDLYRIPEEEEESHRHICSLCDKPLGYTNIIAETHCDHRYHSSCLLYNWLWIRWNCPECSTLIAHPNILRNIISQFNVLYVNRENDIKKYMLSSSSNMNNTNDQICCGWCWWRKKKTKRRRIRRKNNKICVENDENSFIVDTTTCPICLDLITSIEDVVKLNCDHYFHYRCLHEWTIGKMRDDCPVCRADIF